MVKNVAALEICSDKVKFAVGYSSNNKTNLLYYSEKELPSGSLYQGDIKNEEAVSKVLKTLTSFDDEALRLKVDTDEISLLLPALGFEVYRTNKTTNVVSTESIINELDINNVMSLVKKEAIPSGNLVVDIIPDFFMTSSGECFTNPPLQKHSASISIEAQIHTLPGRVITSYQRTAQAADFRVRRSIVSPFCVSELIKTNASYPESYLLLDMGESLSTLSLVGKGCLYGSVLFALGGKKLSETLATSLGLTLLDAEALKKKYGYNLRKRTSKPREDKPFHCWIFQEFRWHAGQCDRIAWEKGGAECRFLSPHYLHRRSEFPLWHRRTLENGLAEFQIYPLRARCYWRKGSSNVEYSRRHRDKRRISRHIGRSLSWGKRPH